MEVVGVVAAIPGLIHIIQGVVTAARGFTNRKSSEKAATELMAQLQDIENILKDVQQRWRHGASSQSLLQRLKPIFTQLRTELEALQETLNSSTLTKKPGRFFKRAYLLSTGPDKALKKSLTSLSQARTSLTLIIAHHNDGVSDGRISSHVR